jgi:hemoglobin-like flavoprotein
MDTRSIALVRDSFTLVQPVAAQAARSFYTRLFARHPGVRALFGPDLEAQGERLMAMIAAGVRLLDRPAELAPALRALGSRHAGYGVREVHYALVGEALLDTLADALGPAFTEEQRAAWTAFYGVVAREMRAGAAASANASAVA